MILYNAWALLIALFFTFLWRYAAYKNRLFSPKTDPQLVVFISRQYAFGPPLYLLALLAAFLSPVLSLLINLGLAVFFAMPNKTFDRLLDEDSREA